MPTDHVNTDDESTGHENTGRLNDLFRGDAFAKLIGVEIVDWAGGRAEIRSVPKAEHNNFAGGVHGGFLFSGLDVALSIASNSWGRMAVAVSVDIHYLAAPSSGEMLTFTATEVSRGRNMSTYALEARGQGKLYANATGATFRTNNWHFGTEAWTESWRNSH